LPAQKALACVIGESMDLVRALGLARIRCAVVAPPDARIHHSRFVENTVELNSSGCGPEALLDPLLRFARAQPAPPVLYYVDDHSLGFVSRFRDQLAEVFRFVVADAGLIDDLVDKVRFRELAERLRLPVPPSRLLSAGMLRPDFGLRFPLVVKPRTRRHAAWGLLGAGAKALQVQTADDLLRVSARLMESGLGDALVQELIPGPETRIESYHAYVDGNGEIAGEFTGRKIRTLPATFGHSTALEITQQEDLAKLGREILDRVALRGVAKLDFKRGPDGALHLLEINPRFTLWHHLGARAGVNLAALVYSDLVGSPRKPAVAARAGVRWCHPKLDVVAAREVGISRFRWLWWALGCEAKSAGSWDDPMPLVYWALRRLFRRRKAGSVADATPADLLDNEFSRVGVRHQAGLRPGDE